MLNLTPKKHFVQTKIVISNTSALDARLERTPCTSAPFVPPVRNSEDLRGVVSGLAPPRPISNPSDHIIVTPVLPDQLSFHLDGYDELLRLELVEGFKFGFDIGFRGTPNSDTNVKNLKSSFENTDIVAKKIQRELFENRLAGPFKEPPFEEFQINPIGVVPKKEPNSFRLITNLSSPEGRSVNDSIMPEFASVQYSSIEDAIKILLLLGKGAYMAKTDVKSAFRIIPVKPDHRKILGIKWEGQYYFDRCLPMGASSSCHLFEKLSTALEFIAKKNCIYQLVHYLDDFLIIHSSKDKCLKDLEKFLSICDNINVPMAPEKTVFPSQQLEFLGFLFDTVREEIRLPMDKLEKCKATIKQLIGKDKASLKELQVVFGLLNFACTVIIPGRAFLESLRVLTIGLRKPYFKTRINQQTKLDLAVWLQFLEQHNGVSLYREEMFISPGVVNIYTDASKSIGLGAVLGRQWFSAKWPGSWWLDQNITFLEFIPITLALVAWHPVLSNKVVIFHTDNEALVSVINKQHSNEALIRCVLRGFILNLLKLNIVAKAKHIKGSVNARADALSRDCIHQFRLIHPEAHDVPSPIPALPTCLKSTGTWLAC